MLKLTSAVIFVIIVVFSGCGTQPNSTPGSAQGASSLASRGGWCHCEQNSSGAVIDLNTGTSGCCDNIGCAHSC